MNGTWIASKDGLKLRLQSDALLSPSAMEVYRVVFSGATAIQENSVHSPAIDLPGLNFSRVPAEPAIHVSSVDGYIHVAVGVKAGEHFEPLADFRDQVIVSECWYPVQKEAFETLTAWVSSLDGLSEGTKGTLATLISLRTRQDLPGVLIDTVDASAGRGITASADSITGLQASLYPYQVEGVSFLRLIAEQGVGCILADEMGLGKTLQVIAVLLNEKNNARGPSLVVAPATLLENWRRELGTFAPNLSVLIHAGSDRPGIVSRFGQVDVVVVSYETAIRDEPLLSSLDWNILALDEAQNIKNPEAQRAAVVKRLPRRVSIAITGTPLENHVQDLWSLTDFVLPGLLGDLVAFRAQYRDEVEDAVKLGELVAPVILRRRVLEVAKDLPEKIEIPQPLLMPPSLAKAYEGLRLQTLNEYGPAGGLVATSKLRMLCAHPSLVGLSDSPSLDDMPKMDRLFEILEEVFAAGERALVFSTYQAIADLLKQELERRYPNGFFAVIDGRVPVVDRQPIIDSFFSSGTFGALLLNPKAAGAGLNITAANHVIHFNPEWNPALTDQATARAYRRKQTRPVTVHYLYFLGTVEEVIVDRAAFKRELAGEAVTGHEGNVEPLDIARALQVSPLSDYQKGYE